MKIAILGTRGIPANYGGFEAFAQELSTRLAAKGYVISVYCRKGNSDWPESFYEGVQLVILPTIKHKYLDTIAHTFLSVWHVSFSDVDIVYICNAINSVFAILPRLFGKCVIINVDGLEWKRAKWNKFGKWAYQVSEWVATKFAHVIISDSRAIQDYYKERFKKETTNISYGAQRKETLCSEAILEKYCLKKNGYILYVSRLEPENNALIMIKAYEKVKTDMPLAIVGSAPYGRPYINKLRSTKDSRVKFLGSIYGEGYCALQSHAYIYLHGNEVGGTNPALLEAMVFGNCVIAIGVPFNKEVVAEAGFCFQPGDEVDLRNKIEYLLNHPETVEQYRRLAQERITRFYNWDDVVNKYEHLFLGLLNRYLKSIG
jgi:glycosyltransferase involved in cell wall biosynthesis